jgi:hypothetical protein
MHISTSIALFGNFCNTLYVMSGILRKRISPIVADLHYSCQWFRWQFRLMSPMLLSQCLSISRSAILPPAVTAYSIRCLPVCESSVVLHVVLINLQPDRSCKCRPLVNAMVVYTRHCSSPLINVSFGKFLPIKTILLIRGACSGHFPPMSLPIIWCTP